ncbi:hypothetical protein AO385_1076 [Moraxella catarrhalis]|nr:hypothetical protein AO385_1076 [Moraxella catarrhalis]
MHRFGRAKLVGFWLNDMIRSSKIVKITLNTQLQYCRFA